MAEVGKYCSVGLGLWKMDIKQKLILQCDKLSAVIDRKAVEYGSNIKNRIDLIKRTIETFVFRVYVVGPFSSGKSSMVNRWLGCDVLSTGLTPETAVATELRYGEQEKMELFSLKGGSVLEVLSGLDEENMTRVRDRANKGELSHVVLYMNHPKLMKYSDICLVDLPGLSSANSAHDAALTRFVQEPDPIGIFCLPMKDGTVHGDALKFIKKMSRFGEFNVLLTKSDQCHESVYPEVSEVVKKSIHEETGQQVRLGIVSKETVEDFEKMVDAYILRKDAYLMNRFSHEIIGAAESIAEPLRLALARRFSSTEIDEALAKIEETERSIPEIVDEINHDMQYAIKSASDEVMSKVRTAMSDQRSSFLLQNASSGFDLSQIASVIKTTIAYAAPNAMMDVVEKTNGKANKLLDENLDFDVVDMDEAGEDLSLPQNMSVQNTLQEKQSPITQNLLGGELESYATPSNIGMLLGELLLPSGIGLIVGLAAGALIEYKQKEDESSKREAQLRMAMDDAVAKTRPEVEKSLKKAANRYVDNLRGAAENKIKLLRERMNQLKSEAESSKAEWDVRQEERRQDLAEIERIVALMNGGL